MLYHIKRMLGVGEVRNAEEGMAEFRFRDTKLLLQHIIPLFDQNRLLTSKYYHYNLFKQALLIATNPAIPTLHKHALLTELSAKSAKANNNYVSPA